MRLVSTRAVWRPGRLVAALLGVVMVAAAAAYVAPSVAAAEPERFLYGVSGLGTQAVTEIDLASSSATITGSVTADSEAIDLDPATGRLYYYEWETTATTFGYFDPDTGGNVTVRTYAPPIGVRMTRMAFDPSGQLFMTDVDDNYYSIDHLTGDVTNLGTISGLIQNGFKGSGDMAFAADGTLYVVVEQRLYEVDPATLNATRLHSNMIPVSGVGLTLWTGLAFCDGQMYASNAEGATGRSGIFTVDPVSGATVLEFYAGPAFRDLASCLPGPNTAPVADDEAVTTDEGVAVAITLSASDADGDSLTYAVGDPANGVLTGTAPDLTYTPDAGFFGSDSFTFTANDGRADSNVATISITVNDVNVAPVAEDGAATTDQDTPTGITLSASDADGDSLTYAVGDPANGVLTGTAPDLTYTPDAGFFGSDSFTFTANDGQLDSNTATVTIDVLSIFSEPGAPTDLAATAGDGQATLTWTAPADDGGVEITDYVVEFAPVGGDWVVFADGVGIATTADVTGLVNYDEYRFRVAALNAVGVGQAGAESTTTPTDGDDPDETFNHPDGLLSDRPEWERVDPATLGELSIVDGHVQGTDDPDGTATSWTDPVGPNIEVTVDMTLGDSYNEASVLLRMDNTVDYTSSYLLQWVTDGDYTGVGTIPGPTAQIWRIDPGPAFSLLAEASLPDSGERTLTFVAQGSSLTIREGETVHLTTTDSTYPTGDYFALAQADLSDDGAAAQLDNLRFEALPSINSAPVAADDSVSTDEDVAVDVTLSASDADDDPLTYTVSDPASGTLSGTAPDLTYTPDPGFVGSDSFTFSANDGALDSNTATVSITVTEVAEVREIWAIDPFGQMRSIDVADGTTEEVDGLTLGSYAIDLDPDSGLIYNLEFGQGADEFASWDPDTGTTNVVRTYTPSIGFSATQMAFAPDGTLYVIDTTAQLHTIDPANGDITSLGPVTGLASGVHGQIGDLAFGPDGTAYVASYGDLYTLDLGTRVATPLYTDLFGTPSRLWLGLTFCDGVLYGSDVRGGRNYRSTVYTIDLASGDLDTVRALSTYVTDLARCVPLDDD